MELKLSRKTARKKRRGRGYHNKKSTDEEGAKTSTLNNKEILPSSMSTEKISNEINDEENFVLFEPVNEKQLEALSRDFNRADKISFWPKFPRN